MEHIPGYDEWKLATPWDDEKEITVWFECEDCELEQQETVVVSGRSGTVDVYCHECDAFNLVDYGDDYD